MAYKQEHGPHYYRKVDMSVLLFIHAYNLLMQTVKFCQFSENLGTMARYIDDKSLKSSENRLKKVIQ